MNPKEVKLFLISKGFEPYKSNENLDMYSRENLVFEFTPNNPDSWVNLRKRVNDTSSYFVCDFNTFQNVVDFISLFDALKPSLGKIIDELNHALKDPDYRLGWVSNIAMCFIDCEHQYRKANGKEKGYLNAKDKGIISNNAAESFLKILAK